MSTPDYPRMQSTLISLNQALNEAYTDVFLARPGAWLLGATPSADAQETLLDECKEGISKLAGVEYMEVVGGLRTEKSWFDYASALYGLIRSVKTDLPYWTAGGVAAATAEATAQDAGRVALAGAAIATPILLAIGGLYLFILLRPVST